MKPGDLVRNTRTLKEGFAVSEPRTIDGSRYSHDFEYTRADGERCVITTMITVSADPSLRIINVFVAGVTEEWPESETEVVKVLNQ